MRPGPLENLVWYLNIIAAAALIVRMCSQRLAATYRLLVLYLFLNVSEDLLRAVFAGRHSDWDSMTYVTGQTMKVIVAIFVAMELFRLALVQQPALARFGRNAVGYFFAVAAGLAVLNVLFGADAAKYHSWLGRSFAFERSMDLVDLAVLVLMSAFLLWFPVRTRRNTAICIGGFMVYSFQRWTGLLLADLWPAYTRQFSTAMLCVSLAVLAAWIVRLRRSGETVTVQTGHGWNPAEADRLRLQLDAINARLGRSARHNAAGGD